MMHGWVWLHISLWTANDASSSVSVIIACLTEESGMHIKAIEEQHAKVPPKPKASRPAPPTAALPLHSSRQKTHMQKIHPHVEVGKFLVAILPPDIPFNAKMGVNIMPTVVILTANVVCSVSNVNLQTLTIHAPTDSKVLCLLKVNWIVDWHILIMMSWSMLSPTLWTNCVHEICYFDLQLSWVLLQDSCAHMMNQSLRLNKSHLPPSL